MGVNYLWNIIEDSKEKIKPECLRGKVITVDLSIWIVEAMKTIKLKKSVLKPHIRNIFFRICYLRKLGVKLIVVTEGKAPELKQDIMKHRNFKQYGVKSVNKTTVGRNRFQSQINECCELLDLLGIPYVKAAGEAEQMCAFLNSENISDGCLTNDGDFFLYGGRCIYRDFGIDPRDPYILTYTLENIRNKVGLTRYDMIGIGLLCGCDYTKGVPGIGKGLMSKFISEKSFKEDLLVRFQSWFEDGFLRAASITKSEVAIASKALKVENFPNQKVIDEFLTKKDVSSEKILKWRYPNIKGTQDFLQSKLNWAPEYTLEKVLQLASSLYLEKMYDQTSYNAPIQPINILKTCTLKGVSFLKVEWKKDTSYSGNFGSEWINCPDNFVTVENQLHLLQVLPNMVNKFLLNKTDKKFKGEKKQCVGSKELDVLNKFVEHISFDEKVINENTKRISSYRVDQKSFDEISRNIVNDECLPLAIRLAKNVGDPFKLSTTIAKKGADMVTMVPVVNFETIHPIQSLDLGTSKQNHNPVLQYCAEIENRSTCLNNPQLSSEEDLVSLLCNPESHVQNFEEVMKKQKESTPNGLGFLRADLNFTPPCFDMHTPSFRANTSNACFSNLGDSILFSSLDETPTNSDSWVLNEKNLPNFRAKEIKTTAYKYKEASFNFCETGEVSFNSPLCLVDRLKQKHLM